MRNTERRFALEFLGKRAIPFTSCPERALSASRNREDAVP